MSKHKFKVGDQVVANEKAKGYPVTKPGWKGVVDAIFFGGRTIVVTNKIGDRFRYPAPPDIFDLVEPVHTEKIIIYRNGAEVVAKNTATGKTGIAKCNPADEFDFNTGARLAFDRLTAKEPEQPKYYNHKVVCVKAKTPMFTTGKIYEVKDGYLRNDYDGCEAYRVESIKELNEHQISDFIELIEE